MSKIPEPQLPPARRNAFADAAERTGAKKPRAARKSAAAPAKRDDALAHYDKPHYDVLVRFSPEQKARVDATRTATSMRTGDNSQQSFIRAAVDAYIQGLEAAYNKGKPFPIIPRTKIRIALVDDE
jgi:hypothetical protein